jgi:hypothetical protein
LHFSNSEIEPFIAMVGHSKKFSIGKSRAELPDATIKTGPFFESFARSSVIISLTLAGNFFMSRAVQKKDFQF